MKRKSKQVAEYFFLFLIIDALEKAAVDIQSVHQGTVSKVNVAEGDTVNIGEVLIELDSS